MRTLALLLAACSQLLAVTCPSGYGFYAQLPIDATKVGTADSTNFPVYIQGNAELKVTGSGGHVQNSSGFDIVYGDCSTASLYKFERVFWVGTNGANSEFWIKVPTVSHTTNTNFCVFYGNAAITTDQQDAPNTWDANFKLVAHTPDGTTLSLADSTGVNTLTNHSATATTGQIDGGMAVNGTTQYVDAGNNTALQITGQITLESWVNVTTFPTSSNLSTMIDKGFNGSIEGYYLRLDATGSTALEAGAYNGSSHQASWTITGWSTGGWHQVVGVYNGTTWLVYFDGVQKATSTDATGALATGKDVLLGAADINGTVSRFLAGSLDEMRVSNTGRPASYVTASFNNQSSPSTFLTGASWGNACTVPTSSPSLPLRGVGE